MKESPTEPPLKKLKQARLPFQILSPPVVKNIESPPSQCKRKTFEAASDDDVVNTEVNENKIKPVEKKAKITNNDEEHGETESSDTCKEVEEGDRKKAPGKKAPVKKEKSKKDISSSETVGKSTLKRKSKRKNSNKATESKTKKSNNSPIVVDFVDLCDSPVKTPHKEKKSTKITKDEDGTSSSEHEGNQSINGLDDESASSNCHPALNDQQQKYPSSSNSELSDEITNKGNANNKIKNADVEEDLEKNKSIEESSGTDMEDSAQQSKSSSSSNDKSPGVKSFFKQPSIKELVTLKSSKRNDISDSAKISQDKNSDNSDTDEQLKENVFEECSAAQSPSTKSPDSSTNEANLLTPSTANDSLTCDDSSPLSESNTSSVSTPGSGSLKKISKTPRRMTPKQLLKLKENEERRKEKERQKEEKEKKRAEEKEEKLKLKKEKEEERLRLKQEKEDEKRKEREEKEKKKQAEIDQKNEEKRLKEEERRQKEEEKRAKEEEKRKKEEEERKKKEEKRLKEEQKEADKRKSAQAFASFFVKNESKSACVEEDKENVPVESNFQPFEVKNDMRLAPLVRSQLPEDRRQLLDSALEDSCKAAETQRLYLQQIRSPSYVCGSATRTYPPPDETDDEVIVIESEKSNEEMEVDENEVEKKPEKRCRRAKLLQFHENRRPPYWGTWRKKSKFIRPRAPLNLDKTMLEYEVDSDDEWEEPEDGESLRGSDEEEEQDEQYEEDNDMFVPHGYLSDGEGEDELDDHSPESMKAKLKLLQMEFEAERKEKQEKLKPRLIGCVWFCNSETIPANGSKIAELFQARRVVWEGSLPITVAESLPSSPTSLAGASGTPGTEPKTGAKKKVVKESLMPDIIRTLHGSRKKLSKLLLELLEGWEQDKADALPSKSCLAKRIREIAVWKKPSETVNPCWNVKEEVRLSYGLEGLDIPHPATPSPSLPSPVSNITKFTKVLTTDERLKLLREPPAASKETPNEPSNIPSTPAEKLKTPTVKLTTPCPIVKKRVALFPVAPKDSPKHSGTTSIMNFVTKSAKSEGSEAQKQEKKVEEKVKKRITPITVTSLPKSAPPVPSSSDNDCIIIDD